MSSRYASLDGLRGIAALAVMLFHANAFRNGHSLCPHGYLAVDFFIMLSGFIMGMKYQNKLENGLTVGNFSKLRFVRLYPIAAVGAALGAVKLLLESLVGRASGEPMEWIALASILNLLLLPVISSRFGGDLYPADPPLWSLLSEIVANVVWAAGAKIRPSILALGASAAVLGTVLAFFLAKDGVRPLEFDHMLGPGIRVMFDFLVGLILFRMERPRLPRIFTNSKFLAMALILTIGAPWGGSLWDFAAIYLTLPLILVCGISAGAEKEAGLRKILGDLSYPIYVVHYPTFLLVSGFQHRFFPDDNFYPALIVGVLTSLAAAWVIASFYDSKARTALKQALSA